MTQDLSGTYEVVVPVTLDAAKGPVTEGTVDLGHDDAALFLARGFVCEPNDRTAPTVQTQPVPPTLTEVRDTPPGPSGAGGTPETNGEGDASASLVELVGEGPAGALADKGVTTVEQAQAATDEDLDAIEGVGKKTIEKIRAASGPS